MLKNDVLLQNEILFLVPHSIRIVPHIHPKTQGYALRPSVTSMKMSSEFGRSDLSQRREL